MLRPACIVACLVVLAAVAGVDAVSAQSRRAEPGAAAKLTKAQQLDAKDQRKLAKIRKLEDLKKELSSVGGLPADAFHKLERTLTTFVDDPESDDIPRYDLLLQLADLYTRQPDKRSKTNALHYLHRAALEDPNRVEAYLRLAQLYADMGDSQEQAKCLNMAHDIVASSGRYRELAEIYRKQGDAEKYQYYRQLSDTIPKSFEAYYMLGQYFLDRSNFYALIMTMRPAAFEQRSYYANDPYLINQVYKAASLDINTYRYWAPPLFATINHMSYSDMENYFQRKLEDTFSYDDIMKVIAQAMAQELIAHLRHSMDVSAQYEEVDPVSGKPVYRLKPVSLGFGSPQFPLSFGKDADTLLAEFFIRASVSSSPSDSAEVKAKKEEQVKKLQQTMADLTKTAKAQFGSIKDPKQKAKALFEWLKEVALTNYSLVEGIPAENVLDPERRKYLCLSGTIMYTLLARRLGLDVVAVIEPSHAYAVFYDGGKPIRVETTSKSGFDFDKKMTTAERERAAQFRDIGARMGGILFSPVRLGEISPLELVSLQFYNVASNMPRTLIFERPEYKDLAIKALQGLSPDGLSQLKKMREEFEREERGKPDFKWEGEFTPQDCLDTWFLLPLPADLGNSMMRVMVADNPEFQKDLLAKFDESLDVLARGLQIEPFSVRFRNAYRRTLNNARDIEIGPEWKKLKISEGKLVEITQDLRRAVDSVAKMGGPQAVAAGDGQASSTLAESRRRYEATVAKLRSAIQVQADQALEVGNALARALTRAKIAMRRCPPIPELQQDYLRDANRLNKYLGDVEGVYSRLMKMTGSQDEAESSFAQKISQLRHQVTSLSM